MFGIDFSEILVIFGIALVVLGPEKLPRLARTVGRWIGRARAMARQFREQLEQEADALQRSADLRTPPPSSTPPPAPPSPAATGPAATPPPPSQAPADPP
jgi:sec-independent protein translocase protein TatB